jgi:uncharacterized lipoprotein YmbA
MIFPSILVRLAASTLALRGLLLAGALMMGLVGCAAKPPRAPDTHYDLELSTRSQTYGKAATVRLDRVDMRGVQSGRALVTITGTSPKRFQEIRGHYWHVAAPILIERAFLEAMNAASTDAIFGTSVSMPRPNYRLTLTVLEFAYDPVGKASVRFHAVLVDDDGKIVMAETYAATAALKNMSPAVGPAAGVDALSDALSRGFERLSTALADRI